MGMNKVTATPPVLNVRFNNLTCIPAKIKQSFLELNRCLERWGHTVGGKAFVIQRVIGSCGESRADSRCIFSHGEAEA
jgi:hypothetical protein